MRTGTVMFVIEAPLLLLLSLHCIIYWLYLSPDMSLQTYSGAAGTDLHTDACDAHVSVSWADPVSQQCWCYSHCPPITYTSVAGNLESAVTEPAIHGLNPEPVDPTLAMCSVLIESSQMLNNMRPLTNSILCSWCS